MGGQCNVLQDILPRDALQLGWLVVNSARPLQDYYTIQDKDAPIITVEITNLSDSRRRDSSTQFSAFFSSAMKGGCRLKKGVNVDLRAAKYSVHTLPKVDDWFENACSSVELREWFERKLERDTHLHIYVVTSLHVAQKVRLVLNESSGTRVDGKATVPISALSGDPGILGPLINPTIGGMHKSIRGSQQSFEVKDMIYAVQYREVKFKWWRSKSLERSNLSRKTIWKVMGTDAGGEEEDEDDDAIEATLIEEDGKQISHRGQIYEDGYGYKFLQPVDGGRTEDSNDV